MGAWSWCFWVLGGAVLLLGLLLILRGRWRDRDRDTLRCPRCWYPMSEVVQTEYRRQCPECGTVSVGEGPLRRIRRRWSVRWLGVAVAVLGGALLLTPRAVSLGIFSVFPTTALLVLEPYFHEDRYVLPEEGANYGAASATPTSEIAKELSRRHAANNLSPWQWRLYLRRADLVHTRPRWPRDMPIAYSFREPSWIPEQFVPGVAGTGSSTFFTVSPVASEGLWKRPGDTAPRSLEELLKDAYLESPDASGRSRFRCSAMVYEWTNGNTKPRDLFPALTLSTRVTLVDRPEDAIRAQADASITAILTQECRALLFFRPETHVGLPAPRFALRTGAYSLPAHLAYGLRVEIRRDGQTVATGLMNNPRERVFLANAAHIEMAQWMFEDAKTDPAMSRWDAVISGSARASLRDLDKNAYWSGEFVVPVRFQP